MRRHNGRPILSLVLALSMALSLGPASYADEFFFDFNPSPDPSAEEFTFDFSDEEVFSDEFVFDFSAFTELSEDASEDPFFDENASPAEEESQSEASEHSGRFPGMPEGYLLSSGELAAKQELISHNVPASLAEMTPGEDYAEGEILFQAETAEKAAMIADAYNADLISFSPAVSRAKLRSADVCEAVGAAADLSSNLPAVDPNYFRRIIPDIPAESGSSVSLQGNDIPKAAGWESWKEYYGMDFDPYLSDPSSVEYQYQHDIVNSYAAWGVTMGKGIKVGVIDSGINSSHEELAGRVIARDVIRTLPSGEDVFGHGTHTAGIIGATVGNGTGGAGIAPEATLYSYRVTASGSGITDEALITAIQMAADDGVSVLNMSLGSNAYSTAYQKAIENAIARNVTVVAAAGNENTNRCCYPAAYTGVIAVGSTDRNNYKSSFSNFGNWVTVSAPGSSILSSYIDADDSYFCLSGTSQAAPMVSGVAALYKSVYPDATPAQVAAAIKKAVTKSSSAGMGAGVIDASKLFSGTVNAPVIFVCDELGLPITSAASVIATSVNAYADIVSDNPVQSYSEGSYENAIVYTTDGSAPTVKDGKITNGSLYNGSIYFSDFATGTTITIRAAVVSGMGVLSKITTKKVKIIAGSDAESVQISPITSLPRGKSVTLTASVEPVTANQGVTWEIIECSVMGITLNRSTGKLTAAAKAGTGEITVRAVSKADPSLYDEITVMIVSPSALTASMTVTPKTASLHYASSDAEEKALLQLSVSCLDKQKLFLDDVPLSWTSSNSSVATVDENGLVTPHTPGSATITCLAQDGSSKSASCKVTVSAPADGSSPVLSGSRSVTPGKTAGYKLTYGPTGVKGYHVVWSLENNDCMATISSSGILKIPAGVFGSVDVRADLADDANIVDGEPVEYHSCGYDILTVTAEQPAAGVTIEYTEDGEHSAPAEEKWKTVTIAGEKYDSLANATILSADGIFTEDEFFYGDIKNNELQLIAYPVDAGESCIAEWTSSNPSVADFLRDEYGRILYDYSSGYYPSVTVRAKKAGSVILTCKMPDSGAKKQSFTLKVVTPPSSVSVESASKVGVQVLSDASESRFASPIIPGKSCTNKAFFGSTYGKAGTEPVSWSFTVRRGRSYAGSVEADEYRQYVKLSSAGLLSVNKNMPVSSMTSELFFIDVTASATKYNAFASGTFTYIVVPGCTKLLPSQKTFLLSRSDRQYFMLDTDIFQKSFLTFTSSDPQIAGVEWTGSYPEILTGRKAGTATITCKTGDGSGKACTITVKVS